MPRYFALATDWPPARVEEVTRALTAGELKPVEAKRLLARSIVDLYHGDGAGEAAETEFNRVFQTHEAPSDLPEFVLDPSNFEPGPIRLAAVLHAAGLATSNRDGKRQISGGGVRRDGAVVDDADLAVPAHQLDGNVLQVGRRRWVRIRVAS